MPGITIRILKLVISISCRSFREVAWALPSIGHRQTDQGSEARKAQPCQHLRSHQSLTAIRSRSAHSGNGTVRRVPESARRVTMPRSFTPMETRPPRTTCRDSSMGSKSNSGRLTRSTEDAWSARSISETRILRPILVDDRRLAIDDLLPVFGTAFQSSIVNRKSSMEERL